MSDDLAIKADYFLYGIEIGLLDFEEAISWADSVIEECDEPCGEIIDLALSRPQGRNGVMDALKEIPGNRNPQLSGSYLLGELKQKLLDGANVKDIARKAMNAASVTQQPEDDYFLLDAIDDEIWLAEAGTYGTLEQCTKDLKEALAKYGAYNET